MLSHTCSQTVSSLCWSWILPKETLYCWQPRRVRCSREASLGLQPNLCKAETYLNNKEWSIMAKVFLQVQMHVFWKVSKPFQLPLLPIPPPLPYFHSVLILLEFFTQGFLYSRLFQVWDGDGKQRKQGGCCIQLKAK